LTSHQQAQIQALSSDQLGTLGEALLDFRSVDDIETWLRTHRPAGV
jgi:hypothetical protein